MLNIVLNLNRSIDFLFLLIFLFRNNPKVKHSLMSFDDGFKVNTGIILHIQVNNVLILLSVGTHLALSYNFIELSYQLLQTFLRRLFILFVQS